jgi:tetratricopeptide (TPR) repeat protein
MPLRKAALLLFLLFIAVSGLAQGNNPLPVVPQDKGGKAPDYSQEPFVFEQYLTKVRFENDGTGTKQIQARIRVQSEGGVQALGQLVFGYNSANEKLDIGYVRVRRADGSVVEAGPDSVQDLTAPVAREAPVYTDYHQKHITVPALRPGEVLEYDVTTVTQTPLAPGQFWLEYDFEKDSIVLDEQLELNLPRSREVKLKIAPGSPQPVVTDQGDRKIYLWKSSHTVREDKDKDKDKRKRASSEPKPPSVQLTTFRSWAEVGQWYAGLERDRVKPAPDIIAKAEELTRGSKSEMDKIETLYDYVAKNFRYVSLSLGLGRYQPHSASEILANQYGDCKDKHTLLAAMLGAVGVHANAALINSSRKIDPDVPSPSQFDHVITEIPLGAQVVWVDTTAEVAPFRLLMPQIRGKQALVVSGGTGSLVETPEDPFVPNSQTLDLDGKVSDLGKLDLHVHYTLRGDIETALRAALRRIPRANWKDFTQNLAHFAGLNGDVSDVTASDPDATREPLQFEFTVSEPNYIDWSSKNAQLKIPPLDFITLPDVDSDQDQASTEPIKIGGPLTVTDHFKFTVPAKYTARAPIPVSISRDFGQYKSTYKVEGSTYSGDRTLQMTPVELPADRANNYIAFRRTVTSDQQQVLGLESAAGGAPTIPAGATADELNDAGVAALRSQQFENAVLLFKRVVELEPKHKTAWNALGISYELLRRFDDAIASFKKQLEVNPDDERAWNLIAGTYTDQQKYDEAIAAYKKQLEISPLDPSAHLGLGSVYLEVKKYSDAVPELEQAASLTPDNAMVQVNLGRAYLGLKQNDKALTAFDKGLEIQANPLIWNNEAYELARAKVALDRAQQYAESAVAATAAQLRNVSLDRLTLNDLAQVQSLGAYWDTLGWVYFQRGDLDTAEKYIQAAWLLSQHGEEGDHLAQIYETRGKKDLAMHTYALALASPHYDPDSRGRLAALAGGDKKVDALVKAAGPELVEMRSVKLSKVMKDKPQASADFFLLLSSDASTAEVKFISGDESLRPFAAVLRTLKYPVSFPDGTPTSLVRRATVTCSPPSGECTLVLQTPESVTSVQ